jgi:hypothetical protein
VTLTTEESGRLRVPLAALDGFDPVGLRCGEDLDHEAGVCTHTTEAGEHVWLVYSDDDTWDWLPRGVVFVDLADPATADRVARWLAARVGLEVGCTAPRWNHSGRRGTWAITGDADAALFHGSEPPRNWRGRTRWKPAEIVVPALAALDPSDDRRLPDGSRYVDRLALALVAVGAP